MDNSQEQGKKILMYKITAANGLAFYDGKTQYRIGEIVSVPKPDPANVGSCGVGLHVSPTLQQAKQYASVDLRGCDFYQVEVDDADIIAGDSSKTRVRSLLVKKELRENDFGIIRGKLTDIIGDGSGDGDGSGYGSGDGYGDGDGSGYGSGYGSGDGYGDGDGDGDGDGYGSGSGDGYGSGYGYGYGDGDGN